MRLSRDGPRFNPCPTWERFVGVYFFLFNTGGCISRGSHDHIYGGAISLSLSGTYKQNHWGQAPWQWPPSVSLYLKYILHIHAGCCGTVTMACNFGARGPGYRSWLPRCGAVFLGKTFHLHMHSLNPGVNGCLAGQWLLVSLNSFHLCDGSRAVCFPGSWVGTGMNRSYNQGKNCKSNYYSAFGGKLS